VSGTAEPARGWPLPPLDPDAAPFFEGARLGVLRIPKCASTGRLFFPPRPTSPFAPRVPPRWSDVSGRGSIWSFVVPHPPLLPPFEALAPYAVVLVALHEDPTVRLVGNVVARPGGGIDEVDPATLAIGARVHVVFEAVGGIHLPRWMLDRA
jgi:uncharacterized OB-fold protein